MSYEVDVWSISLVKVFFVVLLLLLRQMVSEITSGNNGSSISYFNANWLVCIAHWHDSLEKFKKWCNLENLQWLLSTSISKAEINRVFLMQTIFLAFGLELPLKKILREREKKSWFSIENNHHQRLPDIFIFHYAIFHF